MKVLVLGSTGYLENPICEALARSGHLVYAQSRSSKNVAKLAAQELVPFVSDPNSDGKYLELITSLKVDVVVDALGDYGGFLLVEVFNKISKAAKESRSSPYKLTYIAISGGWAHGSQPPASLIHGIADERVQAVVRCVGSVGGWSSVQDIAEMVLRVAERSPICKHLVFDCANSITEPQSVLLDKLAALTGAKGWIIVEPKNDFERAMTSSNTIRPGLARALLGWEARKPSFTDRLDVYYASWKAARK